MKKKTIISAVKVLLALLLIILSPIWTRYPGGYWKFVIGIAIVVICISIIVDIIREIRAIVKQRKSLKIRTFLRLSILVMGAFLMLLIPADLEDKLFGKKILEAYHESSHGGATFVLREPNGFEIHDVGFFLNDEFYIGKFTRISDTLYLTYNGDSYVLLGNKLLIDQSEMKIKRIIGDSVVSSEFHFHLVDKENEMKTIPR
ncbi:MAG: hypothetical protein ABFS32_17265 [Bacteroidota bacterium]